MRFQQLNRNSNAILKKKLYKSGKNWIIKSSLSFAGGLILFGVTQAVNVSADPVTTTQESNTTPETQTNTPTSNATSSGNSSFDDNNVDKNNQTVPTSKQNNTQNQDNLTNKNNDVVQNNTIQNTKPINNQNSSNAQSNINTQNSVTNQNVNQNIIQSQNNLPNQNVQIKNNNTNLAQATQTQPETQATASTESGTNTSTTSNSNTDSDAPLIYTIGTCDYYVDDNQVLHVGAGEITQEQYDEVRNLLDSYQERAGESPFGMSDLVYNSISFDGKVIVHGNINHFFGDIPAKTIKNFQNFDTSDVTDLSYLFAGSYVESVDLGLLDTSKVTNMQDMFYNCLHLKTVNTKNAAGQIFDASKVTNFSNMFDNDSKLETLDLSGLNTSSATNFYFMFSSDASLKSLDVSSFDTSNVTNMGYMFNNNMGIKSIDVSHFDTSKVTDMVAMFNRFGGSDDDMTDIKGLENFDTSKVTDMSAMFQEVNFDSTKISHWDTSKVTTMDSMFQNSKISGKLDLSNFVGDSLQTMGEMFYGANKLTEIDLRNLNTPNLEDVITPQPDGTRNVRDALIFTFENCTNLQKVDLSKFTGGKVANFNYLFSDSPKLTTIIWPNFHSSYATSFKSMFQNDTSLTSDDLDFLSQFDTSHVTDFSDMFMKCPNITTLKSIENWDVSSANSMAEMFEDDSGITDLDLSKWNINNINNLYCFVSGCSSLANFKLPIFDNPAHPTLRMDSMIKFCDNLHLLDFTNFEIPTDADKGYMFYGTNHLYKLILNNKVNLNGSSLSYFDIYKGWYNVGNGTDDDPEGNLILHNGNEMMTTYSNNEGPDETWVIAERKFVDYEIEYVDYKTQKDLNSAYDIHGNSREGWDVAVPALIERNINLPGYDNTTNYDLNSGETVMSETLPLYGTPESKNLVYKIGIKQLDPFVIRFSDVSDAINLRVNDPDAIKNNVVLNNLNNVKQLDPDKTVISALRAHFIERDIFAEINVDPPKTEKALADALIYYEGEGEGKEVKMSVEMDVSPVYLPDQNNTGDNGNSGTTTDRKVESVKETISTFSDRPNVQLYDYDGNAIEGKTVRSNTDWENDEEMTLNGIKYYRISTDEWIKASDAYVYVEDITKVRTYKDGIAQLKNIHMDNTRILAPSTDWKTDRYTIADGQFLYRVSTNEFIPMEEVYEYQDSTKVIHSRRATPVYDERGNNLGRTLKADHDYKTDKVIKIDGDSYHRVASNEFVKDEEVD